MSVNVMNTTILFLLLLIFKLTYLIKQSTKLLSYDIHTDLVKDNIEQCNKHVNLLIGSHKIIIYFKFYYISTQ